MNDVDRIVSLLERNGFSRGDDFDAQHDRRPFFYLNQVGSRPLQGRVIVGSLWTTFYIRVPIEHTREAAQIVDMQSVRTADEEGVYILAAKLKQKGRLAA